jgi:hypothetical protein
MRPSTREAPLLSLCFCLGVAALVRLGLLWGHDLRGAFGPDAPGAASAAFAGFWTHPYPLHPLLIRVFSLAGGAPAQGALLLSVTAGLGTVAAVWLMGRVLTGGRDGRSTALLAAVAPLLVQGSLLRGGDALAVALVAWGVASSWWGASRDLGAWSARAALLLGGALWGLSALAKPIALPLGIALLLVPLIGGRRSLPWLVAGMGLGALLAAPFLGPLLRPQPAMGLLGSWWLPGPPSLAGSPGWLAEGLRTSWSMLRHETWAQLGPLLGLAVLGCLVAAPRRAFRLALLGTTSLAVLLLAAMMGERLQPRYLAAISLGWLVLGGLALTPRGHRQPRPEAGSGWGPALLAPLPLSMVVTLFFLADLHFWDGLSTLRSQEEGTAAARGLYAGWAAGEPPREAYADSSVCGALELEALGRDLAQRLPAGGTVVSLPLRDGRAWHLLGPLAAHRDDLELLQLGPECCPDGPTRCAASIEDALAASGGGALVLPLAPPGRCETGALSAAVEPWAEASLALVDEAGFWYGSTVVPAAGPPAHQHLCEALGGRPPAAPARP